MSSTHVIYAFLSKPRLSGGLRAEKGEVQPAGTKRHPRDLPRVWQAHVFPLLLLLLLFVAFPAAAQPSPPPASPSAPAAPRELLWVLPRAPLGAHCVDGVVCTDLGTWGVHARLTGSVLIGADRSIPVGLLTPAASFTFGGWGELGVHFPILLGPLGTPPLPLPPLLFAKGSFTPPWWTGTHGAVFAAITLPDGPFAAADEKGQPMARIYEAGAALSGRLFWMLHYGLSLSAQVSPGGPPPRLLSGLHLEARLDGWTAFAQATHSAGFCLGGDSSSACQSNLTFLGGIHIPLTAGHSSAAAGIVRGGPDAERPVITATMGVSYDETTRAKYGDGIEKTEKLWMRLFNTAIDPYLDEECMLWDDDHQPMGELGRKSADGKYCEQGELRVPVGAHLLRDVDSTRLCYDWGLRNCVLSRASDKEPWQVVPKEKQARRLVLKENCHVYEEGGDRPLIPLGTRTTDGQSCDWLDQRSPIGTTFWSVPGTSRMCQEQTLKTCYEVQSLQPMSTVAYAGTRATQDFLHGVEGFLHKIDRAADAVGAVATGQVHVQTVAREALGALKDALGHVTKEDAKAKARAVMAAVQQYRAKPFHEQVGDLAGAAGGAVADVIQSELTAGVGSLPGAMGAMARDVVKSEKAVVKTAGKAENALAKQANRAVGKAEAKTIEHAVPTPVPNPQNELPSRHGAFREAKRDAGIPMNQQPDAVKLQPMEDRWGNRILDANHKPIQTREYEYTRPDGKKVVIQDHSAGHKFGEDGVGDQGAHFNVRPPDKLRTGHIEGTKEHYPFKVRKVQ